MSYRIYDAKPSSLWCDQEVVGVQHYITALNDIRRAIPINHGGARIFDATLVLEMDNPHARSGHAISIRWKDRVIGYIPDVETSGYFPEMARLAASGFDVGVRARLWTNIDEPYFDPSEQVFFKLNVGVLNLHENTPLNDPPVEGWALIPRGTSIQVTKENEHFEVLQDYVPPSGHACLLVTLHKVVCGVRSKWEGVEVRLDGERIGELTKLSSSKLLPIVDHYDNLGLTTVCYAALKGSALAAEVVLNVTPAHEIEDRYLENPEVSPFSRLVRYEDDPWNYSIAGRYVADLEDEQPQKFGFQSVKRIETIDYDDDAPSLDVQGELLLNEYWKTVGAASSPTASDPNQMRQYLAPPQPPFQRSVNMYAVQNHSFIARHEKSFEVYVVSALLGGWFGLHHYYMGSIGKGILYTLTGGLFMIGWFVDVVNARRSFDRKMAP